MAEERDVSLNPDDFDRSEEQEEVKEFCWALLRAGASFEETWESVRDYNRDLGYAYAYKEPELRHVVKELTRRTKGRVLTGRDLQQLPEIEHEWDPCFPRGHITLIFGTPGVCKSGFVQDCAKRKAEGSTWPEGSKIIKPGPTLWIDAEGAKTLVLSRMRVWGMDPDSLLFPEQEDVFADFTITDGTDRHIREILGQYHPFVVVDSLSGAHRQNENQSHSMGPILKKLRSWAAKYNLPVVIVHHAGKKNPMDQSDRLTLDRIRGSTLIAAQFRSILAVDKAETTDGKEIHRLYQIKNNLGPLMDGDLYFQVTDSGLNFIDPPAVNLKVSTPRMSQLDKAKKLISELLANGPVAAKEIQDQLQQQGISEATTTRAKGKMRVESFRKGKEWYWKI